MINIFPFLFDLVACSELPNVPFARVSEVDRKAEYQEGDVIHFNCEEGYTSDHTSTFVCTSDGWISTRLGTCFCELNVLFHFMLTTKLRS